MVGSWDDYHGEFLGGVMNGARDDDKLKKKQILKITDEGTTATRVGVGVVVPRCGKHLRRRQPQRPGCAVRMEGYAISHNHGTRKWFLWRRNSSSRKTMFHSHVGGRVVFIDW